MTAARALGALYLVLFTVPAAASTPAPGRHYDNVDYEFSVDVPDGLVGCVSENTNHGIAIYLDYLPICGVDRRPYVAVFADYNVATDALTPASLAQLNCPDLGVRRVVWLKGWTIGHRAAAGCRQYLDRGRISVKIYTMRKTEPDNPETWIDIAACLITTDSRYEHDMGQFRNIVKTIHIAPDGPLK